ncbi:conserved hypothetical protein [Ricinus communis]|uniref:Timeless N-terminal domain-containing protein n=1 Tax=Ricinus communis TaxID=3988 RepID=B9RIP5_RICCO|nr:conserved hypothetical protein [Ricinus communis]
MQELSLICAGLGDEEEDNGKRIGYSKGENCLENLKDLLRCLRRDDPETREVFKQVCNWKVVSKDLIPIIQYCQVDRSLVLNAVKVLVFLTMPIEPSSNDILQQTEYLWDLKSAITCSDTVGVIISLLEDPLEHLEREAFTEDDWKLVQLVLTLFRNILAIQDFSLLQKVGGSASHLLSLRDRFLELMFHENVMDLVLIITQHVCSSGYLRQDNLLLLEIFHYIFMGQEPELIAKAQIKDSKDGSKAVYKGNPSSASHNVLLKPHKIHRSSTKRIVWDHGRLPSMKDDILVLLHDFLNQFLSGGYNVLMRSISEDIEKEHHAIQNSDIVIFFKVAQFVTSFQYHKFSTFKPPNVEKDDSHSFPDEYVDNTLFKGDVCGPIAASMNESMFLLVISRWRNAFDGLKQTNDYNFLSAAGSLMRIMIRMLDLVLKSLPEGSKESQTARILLYKLFYDQTDQGMTQFLLSLIKSFDTHKQPKSDLADLVEMIHLIVRLMENLQARGALRVSKKSRKVRKKKALGSKRGTENELSGDGTKIQDQTLSSNTEQSIDLSILQKINEENSTSDNQENNNIAVQDNQDNVAVQDSQENINNAIQPDKTEISAQDIGNFGRNLPPMDKRKIDHIDDDLTGSSDDSSSDEDLIETHEVDFKVSSFVSTFANHNIIRNLCWLLRFYKSNSTNTNHYIVCMLQRITDDLDLSPMLYQLSLLTTFYDILDEQKSCPCKEYASIVDFLTTLIRRMLRKMKSQPLLFVEVLFWKSRKECHYINAEYLLHELGHMKKEAKSWGNVLADGELGSSQAKGWVPRSIADALGEDEADVVIAHEPYQNGGNAMEPATEGVSKRRRLVLTDEMEMRIKELHEKYKDDGSCVRLIAESLDPAGHVSPAQVFNKLKQLGLKVSSKKRLRNVDKEFSTFPDQLVENGRNTRKKVRAFSKDQEEIIRALFEQFKEHKRCSYMIANALAADNSFTAAQVSRKLKQLGLHIPRQRRSETKLHLRDKELNDFSVGEQVSDDETLLSLRKRLVLPECVFIEIVESLLHEKLLVMMVWNF